MSAYIIGRMTIFSREWMDEYFTEIPAVIENHSGKFLVRGGDPANLEGSDNVPDAAFIIEFPTREHAERFWNSDEFQKLAKLRQTGSKLESVLVDGI